MKPTASPGSNRFIEPFVIVNLVLYQLVWFSSIFSAAAGVPWLGTLTALAAILWHLSQCKRPFNELRLILLTGLIGGIWDSLLVLLGLIQYPSSTLVSWMAPPWIITLWMVFATTFNVCLRWLHRRVLLAAIFGLLGGPLAWWAGDRLGALILANPLPALMFIGIGWGLLMPTLMKLAAHYDGIS